MSHWYRGFVAVALLTATALSGCAKTTVVAAAKKEPFTMERVGDLSRLTLEAHAAKRIGVKLEKVGELSRFGGETARTTVPYGAVIYDAKGATWVYTNPKPLVFFRQSIVIDYVEGDVAVLRDGPPAGTLVVTDGAAQLTGIEFGVGK